MGDPKAVSNKDLTFMIVFSIAFAIIMFALEVGFVVLVARLLGAS